MSISSLFAGMEAYLDGDISYTDTVDDTTIAEQTAEVASDTADASEEAKDTEVASQMLSRMCDMYDHVKQFGIDRTFVSLYNRHGELDRVCGMQFPSCESMDVVGDRYSQYSTAFIAAMESSGSGLWAKIKAFIAKIWNWIKNVASKIWEKIKSLFGIRQKRWQKVIDFLKRNKGKIAIGAGITAALVSITVLIKKFSNSKLLQKAVGLAKRIAQLFKSKTDSEQQITELEKSNQELSDTADKIKDENKDLSKKTKGEESFEEIYPSLESDNFDEYYGHMQNVVDAKGYIPDGIQQFIKERYFYLKYEDEYIKDLKECVHQIYAYSTYAKEAYAEASPIQRRYIQAAMKASESISKIEELILKRENAINNHEYALCYDIRKELKNQMNSPEIKDLVNTDFGDGKDFSIFRKI